MPDNRRRDAALKYHSEGRRGKIEVRPTKSLLTARDLSLAYTPGVAYPCREIHENPDKVFDYTARGNLVAVITNGTAVLGLGNIGPLASKPVMEGKGVLFKKFADIDVFDIELNVRTADEFIAAVKAMEPTFGGINLEDIAAPDCFFIENRLKQEMSIPVFHDDQHGTAIIAGAALINALELTGRSFENVRVVYNGAGAAGIACCNLHLALGVRQENIMLCDSRGVVYKGRSEGMNRYKDRLAADTDRRTLADALVGADVFLGVSVGGVVTGDMIRGMADRPIILALANPDPEITYDDARAARPDAIVATGRSDFPNQVNNVLGFPYIFRGALDCLATSVNTEMKLAAARALAELAREDVPDSVRKAYGTDSLQFGPEYLIPKPFDPRIMLWVTPAVARAAMDTGVARKAIPDMAAYRDSLEARMGKSRQVMRTIINKARLNPQRIAFPEGEHPKIIRAAQIVLDEGIGMPILIGDPVRIRDAAARREINVDFDRIEIVNPATAAWLRTGFEDQFYETCQRRGVTRADARRLMRTPVLFGMAMVANARADACLCGLLPENTCAEVVRNARFLIDFEDESQGLAGLHLIFSGDRVYFFADTIINIDPDAERIAGIALQAARFVRELDIMPRVALIAFSNFGQSDHIFAAKMARATHLVKQKDPDLNVDGEMEIDIAMNPELRRKIFPFSTLHGRANTLIFSSVNTANTAYRTISRIGDAEKVGPVLLGLNKSVHTLQPDADVEEIVNMAALAAMDAYRKSVTVRGRV